MPDQRTQTGQGRVFGAGYVQRVQPNRPDALAGLGPRSSWDFKTEPPWPSTGRRPNYRPGQALAGRGGANGRGKYWLAVAGRPRPKPRAGRDLDESIFTSDDRPGPRTTLKYSIYDH